MCPRRDRSTQGIPHHHLCRVRGPVWRHLRHHTTTPARPPLQREGSEGLLPPEEGEKAAKGSFNQRRGRRQRRAPSTRGGGEGSEGLLPPEEGEKAAKGSFHKRRWWGRHGSHLRRREAAGGCRVAAELAPAGGHQCVALAAFLRRVQHHAPLVPLARVVVAAAAA